MEQVPDTFPWMFLGYAALWGVMVIYLLSLAARLRALEREIERKAQTKDVQ
jgi:CcmD family protein